MTLGSFNDVLAPVGIKITAPEAGRLEDSQWLVSDGRSLYRFQDGMVHPPALPSSRGLCRSASDPGLPQLTSERGSPERYEVCIVIEFGVRSGLGERVGRGGRGGVSPSWWPGARLLLQERLRSVVPA